MSKSTITSNKSRVEVENKPHMHYKIANVCEETKTILIKKNTDYGNSFETTLNKYGDVALLLRLEDKMNRLQALFKNKEQLVNDESFDDTVQDLAGYCLLYLAIKNK